MTLKKHVRTVHSTAKKTKLNKNIKDPFLIVGIGASAGGLEAISELLTNLPPDSGMAFVIVQHLDPTHESMIDEILSRKTLMPVREIKNNTLLKPNHVYVIPPNTSLTIVKGVFKITPRASNIGAYLPIDSFFSSLAKDRKNKCVGIILSGTASDGAYGLEAIKIAGGLTIAQDPSSAKYDGMPSSAIATGMVDLVLSPKKMAQELVRVTRHLFTLVDQPTLAPTPVLPGNDYLEKILTLLQHTCHVDFRHYKRNTLNRRISRRMVLKKTKHLGEYCDYLVENPNEIKCLYADILINVTEFFRNASAFTQLKKKVLPKLIHHRANNAPIRIWIIGCATGEEVYSVVMSLLEVMGTLPTPKTIQVFATDISEQAILKARQGIYPDSISNTVSKERLERFFIKTETGYRIKNAIREMCLFSWHDVTSNPPYAKLDLICCRNLMIYFDQTLQERILPILHYALKPGGFLWLGNSESVGKMQSLFQVVDKTNKVFSRKSTPSMQKFYFAPSTHTTKKELLKKTPSPHTNNIRDITHATDHIAALNYAPPGVVVNDDMEIVLVRGEIGPYLQMTTGQPSFHLFKMASPALASDLRTILRAAKKGNGIASKKDCSLQVGKQIITFRLDVIPFNYTLTSNVEENYFLITFDMQKQTEVSGIHITESKKANQRAASQNRYIKELEKEQTDSKSYQKSLIQDFEITQEELTSTNEELQTIIEELQSTNEELETAKEELQSANEELTTVNDELQIRNVDLAKLYDDLVNVLACVDIPIVMVDMAGLVRRFTPKASKMLNLIHSDVGRPISHINPNFDKLDLGLLVAEVIETMTMKEMNIQDRKGRWFRLQIRPYKTTENKINGAVVSLVDINRLKQSLLESESLLDYSTSIANTVHLPLVVLDKQLRLKSANNAFYKKFRASTKDVGRDLLMLLGIEKKRLSDVRKTLMQAFISYAEINDLQVEYQLSHDEDGVMQFSGKRITWIDDDEPNALLLCIQDITDRLNMEKSLREAIEDSRKANHAKDIFLATLSHELRTPLTAILCWVQILIKLQKGTAKVAQGLEAIEQNAIVQGQLIDDLLDVSRIQSGKIVLSISKIDPRDVVRMAVESLRPLAEKKSVRLKMHTLSLKGNVVAADPARLQQVIWNLLINAIKFSQPNKVINITVKPLTKAKKQFVAIQVIDQGKGMRADFLPQLFTRFTQADSSTTRLHGGLGLGLTIASDLLKLFDGSIEAKSGGTGKGSTFTILLPLIPNDTKHKMKAKLSKIPSLEDHTDWQRLDGLRILIVEDEQHSLDALTELLNFAGAKTISVTNAVEAMNALDHEKPDILISDIAMPDKDGISLIKSIRKRTKKLGGEIPAIALTAYTTEEDKKNALAAGFNVHLGKPFNSVKLITRIANLAVGRTK